MCGRKSDVVEHTQINGRVGFWPERSFLESCDTRGNGACPMSDGEGGRDCDVSSGSSLDLSLLTHTFLLPPFSSPPFLSPPLPTSLPFSFPNDGIQSLPGRTVPDSSSSLRLRVPYVSISQNYKRNGNWRVDLEIAEEGV